MACRFSNWSTSVTLLTRTLLETLYWIAISAERISIRVDKVKRVYERFSELLTESVALAAVINFAGGGSAS